MGRSKDELEAIRNRGQVPFRLLGNMRRVIIQDHPDLELGGIKTIEGFEKINKLGASMSVLDIPMDMAGEEVDGRQKRNGAMSFIF